LIPLRTLILGRQASGKSLWIDKMLKGEDLPEPLGFLKDINTLSLNQEDQNRFFKEERHRDQSDILQYQDMGTLLGDFLGSEYVKEPAAYGNYLNMENLLQQGMAFLSTGERRKAFILHRLLQKPHVLILENPSTGQDRQSRLDLIHFLSDCPIPLILLLSRSSDIPQGFNCGFLLEESRFKGPYEKSQLLDLFQRHSQAVKIQAPLPPPPHPHPQEIQSNQETKALIELKGVNLSYYVKRVLNDIHWTVKPGEFWQLIGPNGSGKSSLLSMINGDNPRAFGQPITLFGKIKGSGETLWDLRKKMGLFSMDLQQHYPGRVTLAQVILSGFHDSLGLYEKPSGYEKLMMKEWLNIQGMHFSEDQLFKDLSPGKQRLILLIRALVKHPPLLLLDEPLLDLDENNAGLMAQLINLMAEESTTALIFVSHREEPTLKAPQILELCTDSMVIIGIIRKSIDESK
jgi:molybdate transport system ATP-binding protein